MLRFWVASFADIYLPGILGYIELLPLHHVLVPCVILCTLSPSCQTRNDIKKDCQMSVYRKADPDKLIQWVTHESRSSAASNSGLIRIRTQPQTADAWHQWLMSAARRCHPRFFGHFWPSVWPSSRSNFDLEPSPLDSTEIILHIRAYDFGVQFSFNNVLPSCKLSETSMLRLQVVVQSTLFPEKKSPRLEKLSKPPQGGLLKQSLPCARMWWPSSSSSEPCSCSLSSSLSSHFTPDQLVLSNADLQPNKNTFREPSRWRGSTAPWAQQDRSIVRRLHVLVRASCIPPVELRLSDSYSSGFEFVCRWWVFSSSVEFGHVVLDLFSPFPTRAPPRKYPWQQPTSIVDLPAQKPCHFFFRKAGQLEHSLSSLCLLLPRGGEKKHPEKRQTTDQTKSFSALHRWSVLSSPRSRSRPALQRRDFLSKSKCRKRPLTQPDVADCWPCSIRPALAVVAVGASQGRIAPLLSLPTLVHHHPVR